MAARYEWDENKAETNLKKHDVSFNAALLVFADQNRLEEQDRYVDGEERWQTIGRVDGYYILLVAHTIREEGKDEVIRIISARRATKPEQKRYEQQ